MNRMTKWRFICLVVGVSFVLLPCLFTVHAQSTPAGQTPSTLPDVISRVTRVKGLRLVSTSSLLPPTDTECRIDTGVPCYSPQEIQNAYGLTPLLNAGYTGAGQTIIIIDSFGSPTIANDLSTFDAGYGLPAPPSFTVLAPLGTASFDPSDSDQVGWASETTLDVEWAHALAPGAGIVLLTSPVSETEGVQGLPEFLQLEQYALDHHLGKIISQSWGATENTLFDPAGQQVMADFERFYLRAALENVTILASTGDSGSANIDISGNYYPFPTVEFPASSPLVTAVGGTSEGAPQWAGIIADGNQLAGHPLGFLNLRLYLLRGMGFHDVTTGNNSFHGVPGYNATPGWDLATGWGTPNLSRLLWVLARQQ